MDLRAGGDAVPMSVDEGILPLTVAKVVLGSNSLAPKDLVEAAQVCKLWQSLVDEVWPQLSAQLYPAELIQVGPPYTYATHKALVLDNNRRSSVLTLPQPPRGMHTHWKFNCAARYYQARLLAWEFSENPDHTYIRLAYDVRGETDLRRPFTSHLVLQLQRAPPAVATSAAVGAASTAGSADATTAPGAPAAAVATDIEAAELPSLRLYPTSVATSCGTPGRELQVVCTPGHYKGVLEWGPACLSELKNKLELSRNAWDGCARFQLVFLYANSPAIGTGIRHSDYTPVVLLEGRVAGIDPLSSALRAAAVLAAPGLAERAVLPESLPQAATTAAGDHPSAGPALAAADEAAWSALLPEGVKARGADWLRPDPSDAPAPVWQKTPTQAMFDDLGVVDIIFDDDLDFEDEDAVDAADEGWGYEYDDDVDAYDYESDPFGELVMEEAQEAAVADAMYDPYEEAGEAVFDPQEEVEAEAMYDAPDDAEVEVQYDAPNTPNVEEGQYDAAYGADEGRQYSTPDDAGVEAQYDAPDDAEMDGQYNPDDAEVEVYGSHDDAGWGGDDPFEEAEVYDADI